MKMWNGTDLRIKHRLAIQTGQKQAWGSYSYFSLLLLSVSERSSVQITVAIKYFFFLQIRVANVTICCNNRVVTFETNGFPKSSFIRFWWYEKVFSPTVGIRFFCYTGNLCKSMVTIIFKCFLYSSLSPWKSNCREIWLDLSCACTEKNVFHSIS